MRVGTTLPVLCNGQELVREGALRRERRRRVSSVNMLCHYLRNINETLVTIGAGQGEGGVQGDAQVFLSIPSVIILAQAPSSLTWTNTPGSELSSLPPPLPPQSVLHTTAAGIFVTLKSDVMTTFSRFQGYHTVLLPVVTVLCFGSPELTHLS